MSDGSSSRWWQTLGFRRERGLVAITLAAIVLAASSALLLAFPPADDASSQPTQEQAQQPQQPTEEQAEQPQHPFPNRFPLPPASLDGGKEWLNTSGPISLRDLQGKVVLFDFWTYCCINCMHVLPDLKFLEQKYANQLVVVGIHSAKFDTEKDSENIRRAIMRYEIEHPVVNDAEMQIWRAFGVNSWPTLVVVDPEGQYCGYISGEGHREVLDQVISRLIDFHRAKGTLDETPVRFELESHKLNPTPLRFPGKILADAAGRRLFISDSNHNRIVISSLDGKLLDVIGTGAIGADDGSYAAATFDHPQGMALVGETLYVADTENHLLRAVDLRAKQVTTLAGTGVQADFRSGGGALAEVPLNSPWALAHVDGVLYIAMAGPHQLWKHKLGSPTIEVFSGTGREDIRNGGHAEAAYAQPSGLASDGKFLFVADSEGSAVRKVAIDPDGEATTLVGTSDLPQGRSLFEFGDRDGVGDAARLQHPLDVAYREQIVYVADAYNHKIKKIKLTADAGEVVSWLGDGKRGDSVDPLQLAEPEGLSITGDNLYIADTNNHRVVVADLKSGKARVLQIDGLQPPAPMAPKADQHESDAPAVDVEAQQVQSGDALRIDISPKLPADYKLNDLAPLIYRLSADGEQELIAANDLDVRKTATSESGTVSITVPLAEKLGKATLQLALTFGYCREGKGGLCKINTTRWRVPVELTADATADRVKLEAVAE